MDLFFEAQFLAIIFTMLFGTFKIDVSAELIDCIKSDECSCKTNTKPQQEISLWSIPSGSHIHSKNTNWRFDIDLCHGLTRNTNASSGGCQNSTVCQYSSKKNSAFEIGKFGNVTFSQYDNQKKSIVLQYYGSRQENVIRSIAITLQCMESGTITRAEYGVVMQSLFFPTFTTKITTKAACLRPVGGPTSPSTSQTTLTSTTPNTSPVTTRTKSPKTPLPATTIKTAKVPTTSPKTKPSTPSGTSQTTRPNTSSTPITTATRKPTTSRTTSPNTTSSGTSSSVASSSEGLKTVYIALITVAGFVIVLALGLYLAYKIVKKRKRGLLLPGEESEDSGFLPGIQIQNAAS